MFSAPCNSVNYGFDAKWAGVGMISTITGMSREMCIFVEIVVEVYMQSFSPESLYILQQIS